MNSLGATTYDAATADLRLFKDWLGYWGGQLDANQDWVNEAGLISVRAWKSVLNDPHAGALLNTACTEIIGTGMRFKSQFQADSIEATSVSELEIRRQIDTTIAAHSRGSRLDAGNVLSRVDLETQLLVSGFVSGDGIAVRAWKDRRPGADGYATCWRVLDPARVCNPDSRADDGRFFQGFELVDGEPVAIHVISRATPGGPQRRTWERIPFFAADGSRNVIHYSPDRTRPGAVRGVSKFAILLTMAKQLMMTFRAHVLGKGIQAMHPMAIKVNNPKAAAEAAAQQSRSGEHTPIQDGAILYLGKDSDVVFPSIAYNGDDFSKFVETALRSFTAAWGYPWQFVLQQLTDANLAAAQAALDQADKTTTIYQEQFVHQVSRHLDESLIREAAARDRITVPVAGLESLLVGSYTRPRRADANRLRTRQAAQLAITLGVSPSTAFAEMGYDYADEQVRTAQDLGIANRNTNAAQIAADAAYIDRVVAAQNHIDTTGAQGITWPAVIASSGAITAPGAYIAAVGSSLTAETAAIESTTAEVSATVDQDEDQTDPADASESLTDAENNPPAGTAV